jgi:hypothetical protein
MDHGSHLALYPSGYSVSLCRVKISKREAKYSHSSSCEVKNPWISILILFSIVLHQGFIPEKYTATGYIESAN